MRKECIDILYTSMMDDDRIVLLTADLGFGLLDPIRQAFSKRFHNVGAAEQLLIGAGIGLAESGKIPVCYSMSSFVLYRPFELLRNYLNYEQIPVKLLGSGRDRDYSHDGISHWAHDDEAVLASLPNIKIFKPADLRELQEMWPEYLFGPNPAYLTRKI